MSAPAWMPLYVADYLADTGHLSMAEHGAYMLLIMHYWRNGRLPNDDQSLASICHAVAIADWLQVRDKVMALWQSDAGRWHHKRLDHEIAKTKNISNVRRLAGKAGANARYGKPMAIATQSPSPSPSFSFSLSSSLDSVLEQKPIKKEVPRDKPERELVNEFNQRFWAKYPRRIAKQAALKAWLKVRREISLEDILAGLEVYVANKPEAPFVKHPATWLNGGCWNDDPAAIAPKSKSSGKPDPNVYVPKPPPPDDPYANVFVEGFMGLHGEEELAAAKAKYIKITKGSQ